MFTTRNIVIGVIVLAIVAVGGWWAYTTYVAPSQSAAPAPIAPVNDGSVVSATARVVPAQWAVLSFPIGGRVVAVTVEEGDQVSAGQELVRLDDATQRYAVATARANLASAEASLAQLKAGARTEDIAAAQSNLDAARANLDRVRRGATAGEIAVVQAQVNLAQAEVNRAQSNYDRIKGWGGTAEAEAAHALNIANANLAVAQAELARVKAAATPEAIAAAQAQVDAAQAAVTKLKAGATDEEIAVAQAQVDRAKAALGQAEAASSDVVLTTPFGGTVGRVSVHVGEMVTPGAPVIVVGNLDTLRVETTDLDEVSIGEVQVGQECQVTVDALPGKTLRGQVARIAPMSTAEAGGTNYTVIVELLDKDPALRWGMTAYVDIPVK
ncbi:MAG: efflux RND transporter periplasmic adaptor subunit [Chloroflexi bacterium]|nr:efflux RND transporter periplasmic adaptor subunit [Chloroflexota bacterium]MBU1750702.1 efflux RND transporter periplasmic adaptor subunit [Chloroflexota bacterium]MBU1879796.1 efflux RND transporter periplasmic adaptor subunit [Chloroflexota bacterium]